MGKSAFNKLAETTDGDDMDEIALKLKAMLKGYRRFVPISLQMLTRNSVVS